MSSEGSRPFINTGALCKETSSYVQFPSQSDVMIASLQLFHEVPCCIMNLIISTVTNTYPDFDAKQVTCKSFTVDNNDLTYNRYLVHEWQDENGQSRYGAEISIAAMKLVHNEAQI